ncbi:uncharacterized protein LOC124410387 [Diprion similis]|uniref:uncharacterized protein LOC124410387 n=1 Tax=Diprion similis TaxID=362088 RepID=UPI001EF91D70|nr:uncharacterized protein LOC124410387 [Diprion similis]
MMTLLFQNNNHTNSKTREQRVEAFAQTLNNAFQQFQKLWNDYKELLDNSKKAEEGKSTSRIPQNEPQVGNTKCRCQATATRDTKIPTKETVALPTERKAHCDPVPLAINENQKSNPIPDYMQEFQIFSQDFCTQGLEESFINRTTSPVLQDIQNVTPKRSKSPIFGSKKTKSRISSPVVSSPSVSEKSVIILNDFSNDTGSKSNDLCSPKTPLHSGTNAHATNPISSNLKEISSASQLCTPKTVKKLGIQTIHNVNTDIIPGTKRKLKQSKLFTKTEQVTDLSICDDVFNGKTNERQINKTCDNLTSTNYSEANNSSCEDSLIQVSPTQTKRLSKLRQKIYEKNNSAGSLHQKLCTEKAKVRNTQYLEASGDINVNNDVEQTDTDLTVFEPKAASTQYISSPSRCKLPKNKKSPTMSKIGLGMRADIQEKMQSISQEHETNDETLFIEAPVPKPKNIVFGKSANTIKLSLNKRTSSFVRPNTLSSNATNATTSDKEMSELELDILTNNSNALTEKSPPRKKLAANNFDVVPRKLKTSPTYAYKRSPVRKKAERARLNGWDCLQCQEYYKATGLTGEELQMRKNQCSRHRSTHNERNSTQKDYWNPDFTSSYHSTVWGDD